MKLIMCILLAGSLAASGATEEQLNKKFAARPGEKLVVDVDFGSINVGTNADGEAAIDVWRKVTRDSKDEEDSFLRDHPVVVIQEGNTITIRSRGKSDSAWNPLSSSRNQNEARYTITVPDRFNATLKTSGGGISLSNLTGNVAANTSGGGLHFTDVRGPLDGNTSGGGIEVADCDGAIKIHTSGGAIKVGGGSGSLDGETSGGDVSVIDFRGGTHVRSSGGGLTLENVGGAIDGSTSGGSIFSKLVSPLPGEVTLETSGGGVTVKVPGDARFNVDASTTGGGVSCDFSVATEGKAGRGHLKGPVNDGGPPVILRTSGGGIHIEKL